MVRIPDIVWSRLARKTPDESAGHPDANLLAALAERRLLERERALVSAHLSECAKCRETLVVSFGTAESEVAMVVRSTPLWRRITIWRWVAAVACCVLALVWQRPFPQSRETKQPAMVLRAPVARNAVGPLIWPLVRNEARSSAVCRASAPQEVPRAKDVAAISPAAPRIETDAPWSMAPGKAKPDMVKKAGDPGRQAALTANGTVAREVRSEISSQAIQVAPEPGPSAVDVALPLRDIVQASPAAGFAAQSRTVLPRASRKPGGSMLIESAAAAKTKASLPGVLWSINASAGAADNLRGVVQKSTDGGRTWEDVRLSERTSFRAVAASGADVWAGGSEGTLVHSSDGGAHWAQVTVADGYVPLAGSITSIQAESASTIKIATSAGEAWISLDGGLHWKRK